MRPSGRAIVFGKEHTAIPKRSISLRMPSRKQTAKLHVKPIAKITTGHTSRIHSEARLRSVKLGATREKIRQGSSRCRMMLERGMENGGGRERES
jgi:hypothetical protein